MLLKLTVMCDFSGQKAPFILYLSDGASPTNGPTFHQRNWLMKTRGGTVSEDTISKLDALHKEALSRGVSFEESVVFAFRAAQGQSSQSDAADGGSE